MCAAIFTDEQYSAQKLRWLIKDIKKTHRHAGGCEPFTGNNNNKWENLKVDMNILGECFCELQFFSRFDLELQNRRDLRTIAEQAVEAIRSTIADNLIMKDEMTLLRKLPGSHLNSFLDGEDVDLYPTEDLGLSDFEVFLRPGWNLTSSDGNVPHFDCPDNDSSVMVVGGTEDDEGISPELQAELQAFLGDGVELEEDEEGAPPEVQAELEAFHGAEEIVPRELAEELEAWLGPEVEAEVEKEIPRHVLNELEAFLGPEVDEDKEEVFPGIVKELESFLGSEVDEVSRGEQEEVPPEVVAELEAFLGPEVDEVPIELQEELEAFLGPEVDITGQDSMQELEANLWNVAMEDNMVDKATLKELKDFLSKEVDEEDMIVD
ncbi:hypothetical protein SERLA73DRAFT_75905 [Serpula lacrymans var. lacrymans S7.3]|uniref:Uncharacterized protein n=2 Tax=Serpula lacrymans var. lacrymans TaxID=341189 RepID=F8Q4K3_SERL3|nr:uncharacterized protein SERLADRAFT_440674 [Serpula lacrymans var. lacrymans S7.9]EGN97058.1 hypothetical protein SERLA73DRAFT_75905 [Serpula lacrymans var. lacrymans S7.3]EGO22654.1 hypothetical protein SERLADRAFT_440674 [Serpula lacrymans var. lacrymans S7.9]